MSDIRLKSQIRALKTELRDMKYAGKWSDKAVESGEPSMFLQLFHFLLFNYDESLLQDLDVEPQLVGALSDLEFAEYSFKLIKDKFNYRSKITLANFFKPGFASQKVSLIKDIASMVHSRSSQKRI